MTTSNHTNNGNDLLRTWARGLQPNQQYKPADLLPGGQYAPPQASGIEIVLDPVHETLRLFRGDSGTFVKTLSPWGGEFRVLGLDIMEALREACRVGYPTWRSSLDEKKNYLIALLDDVDPVVVPEAAPMTRSELDTHLDTCATCAPAMAILGQAIDAGRSLPKDHELRDLVTKAHVSVTDKPARRMAQPKAVEVAR